MTDQHSIIPSPELVDAWALEWGQDDNSYSGRHYISIRSAQWAADQELDACLVEASFLASRSLADRIRAARRPKLPSLKEQALDELHNSLDKGCLKEGAADTIRRALEQLDD